MKSSGASNNTPQTLSLIHICFTFDMRYQLQAGPAFGPGLMLSALETFTAGGYICLLYTSRCV